MSITLLVTIGNWCFAIGGVLAAIGAIILLSFG